MKKNNLISIILICMTCISFGQDLKFDGPVYGYKTYDDFFSNKKTFLCSAYSVQDKSVCKCIDTITKKESKLKLNDAQVVGFIWDKSKSRTPDALAEIFKKYPQLNDSPKFKFDPKKNCDSKNICNPNTKYFYPFLGGTKKLFFYLPIFTGDIGGTFSENGEMLEGTITAIADKISYEFVKDLDFKNTYSKFEDAIKDKPAVLEKYLAEKKTIDKKVWERNEIIYIQKYIKLYCDEK